MIARITGRIVTQAPGRMVVNIDNMGIAYEVVVHQDARYDPDKAVELWVWHHQNEYGQTLYGFRTYQDREMAMMVAESDGIGPKLAHQVVTSVGAETIANAVMTGDTSALKACKGLGPKKLVSLMQTLKTSGKIAAAVDPRIAQALQALRALGHDVEQAQPILAKLAVDHPSADAGVLAQKAILSLSRKAG